MSLYAMTDWEIVEAQHWPPGHRLMLDQMQRDEGATHLSADMRKFNDVEWSPWWTPRSQGPVRALEQAALEGVWQP